MLTFYQYIAANDEIGSEAVCNKYGYQTQDVQTYDDMAACLEALVKAEGEPALMDLVNIHPDRELILETVGTGSTIPGTDMAASCGCSKCKQDKSAAQQYVDAAQGNNNGGFNLAGVVNQGGLFILGSILILGLVIVSSHKN